MRGEAPLLAHLSDALREAERHVVHLRGHMLADQVMVTGLAGRRLGLKGREAGAQVAECECGGAVGLGLGRNLGTLIGSAGQAADDVRLAAQVRQAARVRLAARVGWQHRLGSGWACSMAAQVGLAALVLGGLVGHAEVHYCARVSVQGRAGHGGVRGGPSCGRSGKRRTSMSRRCGIRNSPRSLLWPFRGTCLLCCPFRGKLCLESIRNTMCKGRETD